MITAATTKLTSLLYAFLILALFTSCGSSGPAASQSDLKLVLEQQQFERLNFRVQLPKLDEATLKGASGDLSVDLKDKPVALNFKLSEKNILPLVEFKNMTLKALGDSKARLSLAEFKLSNTETLKNLEIDLDARKGIQDRIRAVRLGSYTISSNSKYSPTIKFEGIALDFDDVSDMKRSYRVSIDSFTVKDPITEKVFAELFYYKDIKLDIVGEKKEGRWYWQSNFSDSGLEYLEKNVSIIKFAGLKKQSQFDYRADIQHKLSLQYILDIIQFWMNTDASIQSNPMPKINQIRAELFDAIRKMDLHITESKFTSGDLQWMDAGKEVLTLEPIQLSYSDEAELGSDGLWQAMRLPVRLNLSGLKFSNPEIRSPFKVSLGSAGFAGKFNYSSSYAQYLEAIIEQQYLSVTLFMTMMSNAQGQVDPQTYYTQLIGSALKTYPREFELAFKLEDLLIANQLQGLNLDLDTVSFSLNFGKSNEISLEVKSDLDLVLPKSLNLPISELKDFKQKLKITYRLPIKETFKYFEELNAKKAPFQEEDFFKFILKNSHGLSIDLALGSAEIGHLKVQASADLNLSDTDISVDMFKSEKLMTQFLGQQFLKRGKLKVKLKLEELKKFEAFLTKINPSAPFALQALKAYAKIDGETMNIDLSVIDGKAQLNGAAHPQLDTALKMLNAQLGVTQ